MRSTRTIAAAAIAAALLAAAPPAARAQPAPDAAAEAPAGVAGDEVAAYQAAVARGTDAFRLGHYAEARTAFEYAYQIHPEPVLLFNIASCWRRLGQFDTALVAYRRFLNEAPAGDPRRELAESTVRTLERELAPKPIEPPPPPPPPAPPRRDHRMSFLSRAGLAIGALGLAAGAAGGFEAWRAMQAEREVESVTRRQSWDQRQADLYQQGEDSAFHARMYAISGAVLVAAGATIFLIGRRGDEPTIEIRAGAGGAELSLSGRF